jgi:hypothetical protein
MRGIVDSILLIFSNIFGDFQIKRNNLNGTTGRAFTYENVKIYDH